MISNSYTFNHFLGSDMTRMEYFFKTSGCTEYPSQSFRTMVHTIIPLPIFSTDSDFNYLDASLKIAFGKDYTRKQYLLDYVKMIMEILEPVNVKAEKVLFQPYTFVMLKEDNSRPLSSATYRKLIINDNSVIAQNIQDISAIKAVEFADEDIISIQTNCTPIREISGARYDYKRSAEKKEQCRKVQFAHTALRLIYSSGWQIAMSALALHKNQGVSPFTAMWIAYHIKGRFSKDSSNYGDMFRFDAGYVTHETFIKRFFDTGLNAYVMNHFEKEQSAFQDYFINTVSDKIIKDYAMCNFIAPNASSFNVVLKSLSESETKTRIDAIIKEAEDSISGSVEKVKFSFNRKLFNSVALKAIYEGVLMPGSKLGRIIFKDENEVVLSVLKTSKFIQVA